MNQFKHNLKYLISQLPTGSVASSQQWSKQFNRSVNLPQRDTPQA